MKKIVFIIPYFGHFNNYFDIWLNSCANNPTIDWLIFTDCKDKHNYPQNVKVIYTTFNEIRTHFQSFYDFPISLEKPYKLCDYRPAYGEIFYEYIKDYDFWGYCDTDLIWGDLRTFFIDEILSKYDKIGNRGHCCLLRNTKEMRKAYRYNTSDIVTYKNAFSSDLAFCFDEEKAFGHYCNKSSDISTFDNFTFFDVDFHYNDYRISQYENEFLDVNSHNIFEYKEGKLYVLSVSCKGKKLTKKEISYSHFQKRNMKVNIGSESFNNFFVVKDKFIHPDVLITKIVRTLDPKKKMPIRYIKVLWKDFKVKIFHCKGVRCYKYKY